MIAHFEIAVSSSIKKDFNSKIGINVGIDEIGPN